MSLNINSVKLSGIDDNQSSIAKEASIKDIAIIGIAVKLPHAETLEQFWNIIANSANCVTEFPQNRVKDVEAYLSQIKHLPPNQLKYIKGSYLQSIDQFDYRFFRITPKEASLMNPLQRLFLETAWKAIEDAGYGGKKLISTNTGVYVGHISDFEGYQYKQLINQVEPASNMEIAVTGNLSAIIPGRVSYCLDLKGPSVLVDTACSSSLVAVHMACQALRYGECDQAIVGGARNSLFPLADELKIGMESSDGYTRTFDYDSDGTGLGEGVIAILLKPLRAARRDHDNIYAVIRGSAVNQDGNSMGITAPNAVAQAEVLVKAWKDAGINPETLSYFEAHGTGTKLGDPIEIDGIQKAFRRYTDKHQFCAIGSVKTNIGHLYEAAGLAGLVKSVLALQHKQLPPSLHFNRSNLKINFQRSPVYLNDQLVNWETKDFPRRCGISSFGFSGTNCHMILEEAPDYQSKNRNGSRNLYIFTISAKSETSLKLLIDKYEQFFERQPVLELADICYTANVGRSHYNCRVAMVIRDCRDLKEKINRLAAGKFDESEVFYGEHRIVTENSDIQRTASLTGSIKLELNELADAKLQQFINSGQNCQPLLIELCQLYIKGAEVAWETLYQNEEVYRVSLPVYQFEPNRCWVEIPDEMHIQPDEAEEGFFYDITWQLAEIESSAQISRCTPAQGCILIFMDQLGIGHELASRLKNEGCEVIEVFLGQEFKCDGPGRFIINGDAVDYDNLLRTIDCGRLSQVVHLMTITEKPQADSLAELDERQKLGFYSLFYITRSLLKQPLTQKIDLVIVAEYVNSVTGEEPQINPENATLFGLSKVIPKEHQELICRSIDIDRPFTIDLLKAELEVRKGSGQVAYRKGRKYLEEFRDIDIGHLETGKIKIKDSGVYVITGGTGGIGLEITGFLASRNRSKLVLVNRSRFPERESWDAILSEGTEPELSRKINQIKAIEAAGSEVFCCQADIANFDEVKGLLDHLRQTFGSINGIIHAAGIGSNKLILDETEETLRATINSKVYGSWILDRLTRDDQMDFFMNMSSIASVFSFTGQGGYVAANSYLDSYTAYRNQAGQKTYCINWTTWKETGMAVTHGVNFDMTFKALPTAQALDALAKFFDGGVSRAIIGRINYEGGKAHLLENQSPQLSPAILARIEKFRKNPVARFKPSAGQSKTPVRLAGRENEDYNDIERKIAEICREILGFTELSIHDSFFQLGADSILLEKLHHKIDKIYPGKLMVADLFEYETIYNLACYLAGKSTETTPTNENKQANLEKEIDTVLEEMEKGTLSIDQVLKTIEGI